MVRFVEAVEKIRTSGFSVADLNYLLRHESTLSSAVAPTDDAIGLILDEICGGLQKIRSDTEVVPDPTGDVTRKKLALLKWDGALIEQAIATLSGNAVYEAPLAALPSGILFPDAVKDKASYDVDAQVLRFAGPMTPDEHNVLLSASNNSVYRDAVRLLFRQPRDFVADQMKAFVTPTTFGERLSNLPEGIIFPDQLRAKIYYDSLAQLLRFVGAMTDAERVTLLGLSSDSSYQSAVTGLFHAPAAFVPDSKNQFLTASDASHFFSSTVMPEERFSRVLPRLMTYLRATLSASLVKQKLGEALRLDAATIEQLLMQWVDSPTQPGRPSITEFLDPTFATSDLQVKLTTAGFPDQIQDLHPVTENLRCDFHAQDNFQPVEVAISLRSQRGLAKPQPATDGQYARNRIRQVDEAD